MALVRCILLLVLAAFPPFVAAEPDAKTMPASLVAIKPSRLEIFAEPSRVGDLMAKGQIDRRDVPSPHWVDDGCGACHQKTPSEKDSALRDRDVNRLCKTCHEAISAHNYIHAVGMQPSSEKRNRMNENMRQALRRGGGVVTCISCHDLTMQCKSERRSERVANPLFFRGGPYPARSTLCYACHNPGHYERLNPHDQISDEGELKQQVCLVCHSVAPNRNEVRGIEDVRFNLNEDLTKLCAGCHPPKPHPAQSLIYRTGGMPHLTQPRPDILEFMKVTEETMEMILPLDPSNGKIFCATCHNPHERGVQVSERADRGADGPRRLRAGMLGEEICMACHNL